MQTVVRVRLNGGRVKVIYHKGMDVPELEKLEAEWPLARTIEQLLGIFREAASRTKQTCSVILESTRFNPMCAAY